jgi:hypothetical protein
MTHPARIETPFPTVEETARILGVPLARAKKIARALPRNAKPTSVAERPGKKPSAKRYARRKAAARKKTG